MPTGFPVIRQVSDRFGSPPTLEAVLGHDKLLGLDVTTVIPELTTVPVAPALAPLLPLHEASMTAAHDKARTLATTFGTPRAA
jgi:FMN-dependent NADH-azoreductase